VVLIGQLEELLTSRDYEQIAADSRADHTVASRNDDMLMVLTVTDGLRDALAEADDATLTAVATPWSQAEEFYGQADPGGLADWLRELAALARRACARSDRLYCWICV
jgi:hypothetical protein